MQRAKKCMLQIMFLLLVTSIKADGRRDISRHLEEFKCKLEESIQCYNEDIDDKDEQKRRIFHSKDHNLGVNIFVKRCQSKNCHFDQKKMFSIITIISNENGDIGDLDSFAKKFIHTVIKYVDHKVDYVSLDNLFITIETIASSYLNDFDSLQSTIGKIKKVLHRSKELINSSFFKIAIAACKEVAFEQVTIFLSRLINGLIFLHKAPTYKHIKNEINVVVKTSPCLIKSYYIENYKKSKSAWNFGGKDSVYNTIEREIIEFEQTLGVRYFSKKPNLFFEFFVNYVFKRDQMPIDQCKMDFKDLVLLEYQKREDNRILENLLFDTCNDMIAHFQEKPKFEGSMDEGTSIKKAYFESLSSDETFIKRLEKYFEGCKFNEIEKIIEEKYKSERIESFRVLPVENITRIIFDKPINIKTMFPLCRILKEKDILERPHEYPLIYINSEFIERYYDYKSSLKIIRRG